MAVVLNTTLTLDPNDQIAHISDFTNLVDNTEYVISAMFLPANTRFIFHGHFDIALTYAPVGVPAVQTPVEATISTVPVPAAATPPARYPYALNDRLLAGNLNLAFEMDPSPAPPAGNGGGAGQFRYWIDNVNNWLRQCVVPRAQAGVYVASEWLDWGYYDLALHKFYFAGNNIAFVQKLEVVGPLTVNGSTTVTGNLNVTGTITGGAVSGLPYVRLTGDTMSGGLTINSDLIANNISGRQGVAFADRTNQSISWMWYAQDRIARLYTPTRSDPSPIQVYYDSGRVKIWASTQPLEVVADNLGHCRIFTTVASVRTWSFGTHTDGDLWIVDESVGAFRFVIRKDGSAQIYAPFAVSGTLSVADTLTVSTNIVTNWITCNNTVNCNLASAAGGYWSQGYKLLEHNGDQTTLFDGGGRLAISMYGASGNTNYYDNDIHSFRNRGTGALLNINNAEIYGYVNIRCGGTIRSENEMFARVYRSQDVIGGTSFYLTTTGANSYINFMPGYYIIYYGASGQLSWIANSAELWGMRAGDNTCYNPRGPLAGNGAYVNLSDRRGKTKIQPTSKGLAEIIKLDPVEFERVRYSGSSEENEPLPELGLVAQDVMYVLPQAVRQLGFKLPDGSGGLDDFSPSLGLSYDTIVAVAVNAIKELNARVQVLEAAH